MNGCSMQKKEGRRYVIGKVEKKILSIGAYSGLLIMGLYSVFLFVTCGFYF